MFAPFVKSEMIGFLEVGLVADFEVDWGFLLELTLVFLLSAGDLWLAKEYNGAHC